jgi:hypothetical protein
MVLHSGGIAKYRVTDNNQDGKFNIRTGLSISTELVKFLQIGDIFDVKMETLTKNDEGDTRVRLADESGWCTLTFRTGVVMAEPCGIDAGSSSSSSSNTSESQEVGSTVDIGVSAAKKLVGKKKGQQGKIQLDLGGAKNPACKIQVRIFM